MNKLLVMLFASFCLMLIPLASFSYEAIGQYVKESKITAEVKSKLMSDSTIKSAQITVKTRKNKVILNGYVPDNDQKQKAEQLAMQVKGVKFVQNNLRIGK